MGTIKGRKFGNANEQGNIQNFNQKQIIFCAACQSTGSMIATELAKYGGGVRLFGYIFIIVSTVFLAFSVQVISTGSMLMGIGVYLIPGSLFFLIVGFILLSKKKIYKCNNCGFFIDRA